MKKLVPAKKIAVMQRVPKGVTVVWKVDQLTGEKKPEIVPRRGYTRRIVVNQ